MNQRIENRTAKYVDKLVQGTLLRRLLTHWFSFVLVISAVFAVLTWMVTWLLDPMASQDELLSKFWYRFGPIVGAAIVLIPIFVYDTIRLTHRMVGPMVRVRRELQSLANGRPAKRMKFRPGDYWTELEDEFNSFCEYVEPHVCLDE